MRCAALLLGAFAGLTMAAPQLAVANSASTDIVTQTDETPSDAAVAGPSPPADHGFNVLPASYKYDQDGFVHMADDGVLRSYAANGTIIDALPFNNAQIKRMIAVAPGHIAPMRDHLLSVYDTVDGHDVHPDHHLNPPREMRHHKHGGPEPYENDEMYEEMDRLYEQSENEFEIVKRTLEGRPSFCIGRQCTTTAACGRLGCVVCMTWDLARDRNTYCFYEAATAQPGVWWNHDSGL
ncbi:hypothetical protein PRZ48_008828 [Zasmidium cellare]|uniref:Uncharacterized protein n=1 Tax=Zasmidium cellare TaxID=395010 RepID=A0ABR0EGY8_ZASCE|nr:hypothetical protein PRZ48_008828 [Zasmidium cellare]